MKHLPIRTRLLVAATALVLSACGGGSGGAPAPDPNVAGSDVPQTATLGAADATAFVRGSAASATDSAEPLRLGNAILATSETAEPEPVAR
jgi:hypothetical protein